MRVTRHHSCRVSPFGHPRINARLAAPRGLSQPPTSFIGSQCQGIHHAPLNTYKHKTNNRNCTSANNTPTTTTTHPPKGTRAGGTRTLLARCSQPLSTNQTPHPTTKMERQTDTHHQPPSPAANAPLPVSHTGDKGEAGLLPQSPIVCSVASPERPLACCAPEPDPTTGPAHPTNRSAHRRSHTVVGGA